MVVERSQFFDGTASDGEVVRKGVALSLGANEPHHLGPNLLAILAAVIGSALTAMSIFLCYGFADRLAAVIGESGMGIILRLSSFLLVCIGVQILWNGASALLRSVLGVEA